MREKVNNDVDTITTSWKGKNANTEKKKNNVRNRRGRFKSSDAINTDFNSESKRNMERKKKKEEEMQVGFID